MDELCSSILMNMNMTKRLNSQQHKEFVYSHHFNPIIWIKNYYFMIFYIHILKLIFGQVIKT